MKFTKVVILASALAVPSFSSSGFAKAADTQTVVLPQTEKNSAENEKQKVEELKPNIGKSCSVTIVFPGREDMSFNGSLKSITTAWIVLDEEDERLIDGKVKMEKSGTQLYLPTKYLSTIQFNPRN